MTGSRPAIALIVGLLMLSFGGAARAQEDLSAGKTPQQLFRLNCAACHKSPVGLASAGEKAGGLFGLENFLAQHYTASGRSAQMIANYLKSVDSAVGARRSPRRKATRPSKPAEAQTESAKKTDAAQQTEPAKASEQTSDKTDKMKADEAKATSDKTSDEEGSAPKADKPKMTEPKPDEEEPAASTAEVKRDKPKPTGDADKKTN